ncbi:PQQ-binding-like beta-propeller repeat protein [Streptomyces sp. NPDC059909]|uniref:outer membrane protein assembly factor BamB family protein n=1 Tax=Streptomyces sp. NPDC059909 TaxID=3346998 RepID=UPI00365C7E88
MRFADATEHRVEVPGAAQPSTASIDESRPAVTLHDGTAYVTAAEGLRAVDTVTGSTRWTAPTKYQAEQDGFGTLRAAPRIVAHGARAMVFAAWERTVPGEGTSPSRSVIEVLGVDAATGKTRWHVEVEPDPSRGDDDLAADGILAPKIAAADDATVVLTAQETTYAFDRGTQALRWKKQRFHAVTMAGGVIAGAAAEGYDDRRITGLDAASGKQRWNSSRGAGTNAASPAGPGLLAADGEAQLLILDAATGTTRATHPHTARHYEPWRCRYDARAVVVCWDPFGGQPNALVAFDSTTGSKL